MDTSTHKALHRVGLMAYPAALTNDELIPSPTTMYKWISFAWRYLSLRELVRLINAA